MIRSILKMAAVVAFIFVVSVPFVVAQDEINKGEFFGGFMHKRTEGIGLNGINVAGTYNFHKYLGIKGDFSWGTGSPADVPIVESYSLTTYMGGIQIKDNSKDGSMVKPFAHVLLGIQRQNISYGGTPLLGVDSPQGGLGDSSTSGFSMAFGGGIDIKVSDRVSIRAIQYDYNPIWIDGNRGDTNRFSFGVVIN